MGAAASVSSLDLASLAGRFAGTAALTTVVEQVLERAADPSLEGVWIHRRDPELVLAEARALERRRASGEALPLAGVPFAVKDNIDVEGLTTTAACPAFAYGAERSAPVVQRLQAAGALLIGKTNLDQFATGLIGHALAPRRARQSLRRPLHRGRIQLRIGGRGGAWAGQLRARH